MKTHRRRLVLMILIVGIAVSTTTGCVMNTTVTIDSAPQGAEVKTGNLIVGLLLFWPSLLWCYGPQEYQYHDLSS